MEEHTGSDRSGTYVGQFPDGALFFRRYHGHCEARGWREYRAHYEPESVEVELVDDEDSTVTEPASVTDANTANTTGGDTVPVGTLPPPVPAALLAGLQPHRGSVLEGEEHPVSNRSPHPRGSGRGTGYGDLGGY